MEDYLHSIDIIINYAHIKCLILLQRLMAYHINYYGGKKMLSALI